MLSFLPLVVAAIEDKLLITILTVIYKHKYTANLWKRTATFMYTSGGRISFLVFLVYLFFVVFVRSSTKISALKPNSVNLDILLVSVEFHYIIKQIFVIISQIKRLTENELINYSNIFFFHSNRFAIIFCVAFDIEFWNFN